MAGAAAIPNDLLTRFVKWGDERVEGIFEPSSRLIEGESQALIFREDFKRHIHDFSILVKYEAASLAQCIATVVVSPFAVLGEFYRLGNRSIKASTCLRNISFVPKHIISSIFKAPFCVAIALGGLVTTASTGVGFLTWHSGEWVVRLIKGSSTTALSKEGTVRDIVYNAIGWTLLAGTAVFVPVPYTAVLIATVSLTSLVAGHIFSNIIKGAIQERLDEYAALIGMQWTEDLRNQSWRSLVALQQEQICNKRLELLQNPEGLQRFDQELTRLTEAIEGWIHDVNMPLKYIVADSSVHIIRNWTVDVFTGVATLAVAVSTVFLKILAL